MSTRSKNSDSKIPTRSSSMSSWEKLKQQRLDAWQPVYSARNISPLFWAFGLLLIPIGAVVFIISNNTQEIIIDYTNCTNAGGESCADVIVRGDWSEPCKCIIPFEITKSFEGEVLMHYGLTNFYQNHREYIESRDDDQLLGEIGTADSPIRPSDNCAPFDNDTTGKFIIPCGAIANSMFNDTIKLLYDNGISPAAVTPIKLIRTGIAWDSDKKHKFKNPSQVDLTNPSDRIWEKFTHPKDWSRNLWELDEENPANNGLENEDFIVWMRISALPNFRKPFRKIDSKSIGQDKGLPAGTYTLEIDYEFEVKSFDGTKSVILTEKMFLGGRNLTLGIMCMSAGSLILAIGIIFFIASFRNKKSSWNRSSNGSIMVKDYGTHRRTSTTRRKDY